jgi:hypothetical protein
MHRGTPKTALLAQSVQHVSTKQCCAAMKSTCTSSTASHIVKVGELHMYGSHFSHRLLPLLQQKRRIQPVCMSRLHLKPSTDTGAAVQRHKPQDVSCSFAHKNTSSMSAHAQPAQGLKTPHNAGARVSSATAHLTSPQPQLHLHAQATPQ